MIYIGIIIAVLLLASLITTIGLAERVRKLERKIQHYERAGISNR